VTVPFGCVAFALLWSFSPRQSSAQPGGVPPLPSAQNIDVLERVSPLVTFAVNGRVAGSPDGKLIACAGRRGDIVFLDSESGAEVRSVATDRFLPQTMAFSSDGRQIVAADARGRRVHAWNVADGKLAHEFAMPNELRIESVAAGPDGQRVAACGWSGLTLWDGAGKVILQITSPRQEGGFSRVALGVNGKVLAAVGTKNDILLWDTNSANQLPPLRGHTGRVIDLVIDSAGRRLASVGGDNKLRVWDLHTGQECLTVSVPGTGNPIRVAFGADGHRLAVSSWNAVRIFDVTTGRDVLTLNDVEAGAPIIFYPDGRRLAVLSSPDRSLKVWDVSRDPVTRAGKLNSPARCAAFSPDGTRLLVGGGREGLADGPLELCNPTTGKGLGTLSGHTGPVQCVAFSPDGTKAISGSQDRTARVWDVETGKELFSLGRHHGYVNAVAWSPDGARLATADGAETVRVWDARSGLLNVTLADQPVGPDGVAFDPTGKYLFLGGRSRKVRLIDATTGRETFTHTGKFLVRGIGYPSDANRPLALCEIESTIVLKAWDTETLAEHTVEAYRTQRSVSIEGTAFSRDGKIVAAACSPLGAPDQPGSVLLWQERKGTPTLTHLHYPRAPVNGVALSQDGKHLAVVARDGNVLVRDLAAERTVVRLPRQLSPEELKTHWESLESADSARAYRGILALSDCPEAVPYLEMRVRPAATALPKAMDDRIAAHLADLDSEEYAVRERASAALDGVGESIRPRLEEVLKTTKSAEVRWRLKQVLGRLKPERLPLSVVRDLRAIEALEMAATPAARKLLAQLAKGSPHALLTQDAAAALARLEKR
jgi:WD40 repeat protein